MNNKVICIYMYVMESTHEEEEDRSRGAASEKDFWIPVAVLGHLSHLTRVTKHSTCVEFP